jgi:hypothetical protein
VAKAAELSLILIISIVVFEVFLGFSSVIVSELDHWFEHHFHLGVGRCVGQKVISKLSFFVCHTVTQVHA